jgi:hypothetical protein
MQASHPHQAPNWAINCLQRQSDRSAGLYPRTASQHGIGTGGFVAAYLLVIVGVPNVVLGLVIGMIAAAAVGYIVGLIALRGSTQPAFGRQLNAKIRS